MNTGLAQQRRTVLNRADLVAALSSEQSKVVDSVARQLGLRFELRQPSLSIPVEISPSIQPAVKEVSPVVKETDDSLWLVTSYRSFAPLPPPNDKDASSFVEWKHRPKELPNYKPLTAWSILRSRLQRSRSIVRPGHRIDIAKLVRQVAQRELVEHIPRLNRRRWNERLVIVQDRSMRLIPFEQDQLAVIRELKRLLTPNSVQVLIGDHPRELSCDRNEGMPQQDEEHEYNEHRLDSPRPGTQVLVLGDLGALANSRRAVHSWLRWGRWLKQQDCQLLALVPCSQKRIPARLRQVFKVESWQLDVNAYIQDQDLRARILNELLTLASPAIRVEPGLLRDLRRLLPHAADASLEVDFWMSATLISNHPTAATIDSEIANDQLRPKFNEGVQPEVQKKVLDRIRCWHAWLQSAPEIWFEELLSLPSKLHGMVSKQDLIDARAAVRDLISRSEDHELENWEASDAFVSRQATRITRDALNDPEVGHLWQRARRKHHRRFARSEELSIEIRDMEAAIYPTKTVEKHSARVVGQIFSIDGKVGLETQDQFWKTRKPDFVSDYGTDDYGAWFEFELKDEAGHVVAQRMRWIRPGTFMMGSPENEPERFEDEGPQHRVTLTRGFWMADTTCTQELWQTVAGSNPSRFKGADKPVESGSFDDVNAFLQKINRLVDGLNLQLPTEAQWEYACRAGTVTPFSTGEQITNDQANFKGKQTLPCKALPPNRWGLFQMHGNVWEWCEDRWGDHAAEDQLDPTGPESGSHRVLRGGCWDVHARVVRSASRNRFGPGVRSYYLGFRCVNSAFAEPTEVAEVPVAEQGPKRTRVGGADKHFRVSARSSNPESPATLPLETARACSIRTDLEEIHLQRLRMPKWAVEFGRDAFGAYADFEVPRQSDDSKVRQRLRWIPPGRFKMGSPDEEPGRIEREIQHEVIISSGYWMFETPCTQDLWLAIMKGENPSRFPDPNRPIERVSWQDAQDFASKLSRSIEISFRLPSEAVWEYACRAGTDTAIYTGDLEIVGDANAPALEPIAWYGGNSGHEFDRDDGIDVTWLENKQSEFRKAATRIVRKKLPNPWGLYDMLGNVWEWCSDWYGTYDINNVVDPQGPSKGSPRVVRGGCWSSVARSVRSAYRAGFAPGFRYDYLGFRCVSSVSQVFAERESASHA